MPIDNRDSRTSAIRECAKLIESLTHTIGEAFDEEAAAKRLAAAADLLGLGARVCGYLNGREPQTALAKRSEPSLVLRRKR